MKNHRNCVELTLCSLLIIACVAATSGCKSEYRKQYDLAKSLEAAGDYAGAVEAYKKAVAANPGRAKVFLRLGDAQRELGQWDEALAAYEKVVSLDPKYSKAYMRMVGVYERKGQLDKAIETGEKGLAAGAFDDSETRKTELETTLTFLRNRQKDGRGVIGPVPMVLDKATTSSR